MLIIGGENMDYSKKLERRKQFEDNQFIRLTKIKSKPRYAYYLVVLIALILLVDLLDNFVTSVNSNVTSCYINEFFVQGRLFGKDYTYEEGLALNNTFNLVGYVIGLLVPFYKALGDKSLVFLGRIHNSIGIILKMGKSYNTAIEQFIKSIEIFEQLRCELDAYETLRTYSPLIKAHSCNKSSIRAFDDSAYVLQYLIMNYESIGDILSEHGEYLSTALEIYTKSLNICIYLAKYNDIVYFNDKYRPGKCFSYIDTARELLQKCRDIEKRIGD